MSKWMRAQDIPQNLEGRQAWRFTVWDKDPPKLGFIPKGYSRDFKHCDGVWFKLQPTPQPPR